MLSAMKPATLILPINNTIHLSPLPSFSLLIRASSTLNENVEVGYKVRISVREWVTDKVSKNDNVIRSLPIYTGGVSLLAVLLNRSVSGIAPVADVSSSQSRADLLTLGLAVTNLLAGLVWLSIRPKTISVSLSAATCCGSLVIVYDSKCVLQTGVAAASNDNEAVNIDVNNLTRGPLYQSVLKSGSQSYLANLSLYPGKSELPFLSQNMQAVILQPLGEKGLAIIGRDTIRGFTTSDQAWISFIGEKLDATLSKFLNNTPVVVQTDG